MKKNNTSHTNNKLEEIFQPLKDISLSEHDHERMDAFLSAYVSMHPVIEKTPRRNEVGRSPLFMSLRFVPALLLALIVTVTGSVVLAEKALPGDTLYGIKIAAEDFKENFHATPEARARYKVERVMRRLDEAKRLAEKGELPEQQKQKFAVTLEKSVSSAIEKIDSIKQNSAESILAFELSEEMKSNVRIHRSVLSESPHLNELQDVIERIAQMIDEANKIIQEVDEKEDDNEDVVIEDENLSEETPLVDEEEDVLEEVQEDEESSDAVSDTSEDVDEQDERENEDLSLNEDSILEGLIEEELGQEAALATLSSNASTISGVNTKVYFERRIEETKELITLSKNPLKDEFLRRLAELKRDSENVSGAAVQSRVEYLEDIRTLFRMSQNTANTQQAAHLLQKLKLDAGVDTTKDREASENEPKEVEESFLQQGGTIERVIR